MASEVVCSGGLLEQLMDRKSCLVLRHDLLVLFMLYAVFVQLRYLNELRFHNAWKLAAGLNSPISLTNDDNI